MTRRKTKQKWGDEMQDKKNWEMRQNGEMRRKAKKKMGR